jgi:internalin A
VKDVSPLAKLHGLKSLSLDSTQVHDLTPLAALANLNALSLTSTPVTDLAPLSGLPISSLVLDAAELDGLESLSGLTKIFGHWRVSKTWPNSD